MKVRATATVARIPDAAYAERQTTVKVVVEITGAAKGDTILGSLEKSFVGLHKTVATAVDRS